MLKRTKLLKVYLQFDWFIYMKITILSQYFLPEAINIPNELADLLSFRGHQVRVVTGYPNYPNGKIFPGYKQKWRQIEKHGNVKVMRVPLFIDHSQSGFKRMLNYLSFAFTSSTARRFVKGSDVIYVYATQMTPAFGPWLWRMTGGAPYVECAAGEGGIL